MMKHVSKGDKVNLGDWVGLGNPTCEICLLTRANFNLLARVTLAQG